MLVPELLLQLQYGLARMRDMLQRMTADDLVECAADFLDGAVRFNLQLPCVLPRVRVHFNAGFALCLKYFQQKPAAASEVQHVVRCGDMRLPEMLVIESLCQAVLPLPGEVRAPLVAQIMADDAIAGTFLFGRHISP